MSIGTRPVYAKTWDDQWIEATLHGASNDGQWLLITHDTGPSNHIRHVRPDNVRPRKTGTDQ